MQRTNERRNEQQNNKLIGYFRFGFQRFNELKSIEGAKHFYSENCLLNLIFQIVCHFHIVNHII